MHLEKGHADLDAIGYVSLLGTLTLAEVSSQLRSQHVLGTHKVNVSNRTDQFLISVLNIWLFQYTQLH